MKCDINENWVLTDRLDGNFDHISSIGCVNNSFHALVSVNMDIICISGILDAGISEEENIRYFR
jgi:hypothetical protein